MSKLLNSLVVGEATALRTNALQYELDRLKFNRLAPTNTQNCIYGQMTGECFSMRATELIQECAERVYTCADNNKPNEIKGKLNGSPKESSRGTYWSPIEIFIAKGKNHRNGNNKMLVDFLKGKRKTLKFK